MAEQLVFDWPAGVALGADDFFVSQANQNAYDMVCAPESWPQGKLILTGPAGCGKSHLARIFQSQSGAKVIAAKDLRNESPPDTAIIIEDAEQLPETSQEALFHLHNHQHHAGRALLITARDSPARWPLTLPDLASRMQAIALTQIADPDDKLLTALILKLFADRQITPPPALAQYLALRIERSFAAAADIVAQLDQASLRDGKPLNQRTAASLLDI
jgi:chromosomal replication initiation ATPase DnaA